MSLFARHEVCGQPAWVMTQSRAFPASAFPNSIWERAQTRSANLRRIRDQLGGLFDLFGPDFDRFATVFDHLEADFDRIFSGLIFGKRLVIIALGEWTESNGG